VSLGASSRGKGQGAASQSARDRSLASCAWLVRHCMHRQGAQRRSTAAISMFCCFRVRRSAPPLPSTRRPFRACSDARPASLPRLCSITSQLHALTSGRLVKHNERRRVVDPLDLEAGARAHAARGAALIVRRKDSSNVARLERRRKARELEDARLQRREERQGGHGCELGAAPRGREGRGRAREGARVDQREKGDAQRRNERRDEGVAVRTDVQESETVWGGVRAAMGRRDGGAEAGTRVVAACGAASCACGVGVARAPRARGRTRRGAVALRQR
jgi:hypothetical protein